MKVFVLSGFIITAYALVALAQNKSVYTSTGACKTIRSTSDGPGSYVGECPGIGGYKIRLIEGDLRQTIDIITPAKKRFELNFWNIYSSFSSVGERIEWRLKGKQPIAFITRFNVADPEDSQKNTSYLLVSRVGPILSCVTDVVPPVKGRTKKRVFSLTMRVRKRVSYLYSYAVSVDRTHFRGIDP
jgi:hypothetical protein